MSDEPKVIHATLGFWVGLFTGMIAGCFVGGVALIGQGLWEEGRHWGYEQCKMEIRLGREP